MRTAGTLRPEEEVGMADSVRVGFRLLAAICVAAAGVILFVDHDIGPTAIDHAAGLVLMGIGALVAAGGIRGQSPRS
jgi:hypothetical protein